jgi:hypothetical protein
VPPSVNALAETSAYAERILAAAVASLAFSSWFEKIGIEIATNTARAVWVAMLTVLVDWCARPNYKLCV